jgi:hypothetical protein
MAQILRQLRVVSDIFGAGGFTKQKRCAVAALRKGIKSFQKIYGDPVLLRYEAKVVADAL